MKPPFRFLLFLLLVIVVILGLHLFALQQMEMLLFSDRIILSYILNYIMAAAVLMVIQSKFNKKSAQTGFMFLGGSGLKFLVFFLFFYPYYQQDGLMATSEFAAFFVPYASCLTLEVVYLSKQLNNQEY